MRKRLEEIGLPRAVLTGALGRQEDAQATLRALIDAHRRDQPVGTILKLEGEETASVFLGLSGWLLASKSLADGQRQIIDVFLPGDMLDPGSADPGTSAMEVEALTDVCLAAIPRTRWREACDQHSALADLDRRATAAAMSRMAERMMRLGKAPAESVIAFALCELCMRSTDHGLVEDTAFHIPMTQQQLGDLCGLSSVHICRTLRRLERNEVLSVTNHMDAVIHDMDAMARIAGIDVQFLRTEIVSTT